MKRQLIYLASGNPHKVRELQELAEAAALPIDFRSIRERGGMPEVDEDTGTFEGNARKKAQAIRSQLPPGAWAMADDSGICVDALAGGPGVESAYFAGPAGDDGANLAKLVQVMQTVPFAARGAHYVCVLLLLSDAESEHVFEGRCHGQLAYEPAGYGGFGYDPLFIPKGYDQTFGVLPAELKRSLSHRAQAWAHFRTWLETQRWT
jgi:XTP/dITP diphosphohydrolase